MRKKPAAVCIAVLLAAGAFYGWYYYRQTHFVAGLQLQQIMVEDARYIHYGVEAGQRPEGPPDGIISRVNRATDYPDENGEANFGEVGMPYWHTEEGLVVLWDQGYDVFEKQE